MHVLTRALLCLPPASIILVSPFGQLKKVTPSALHHLFPISSPVLLVFVYTVTHKLSDKNFAGCTAWRLPLCLGSSSSSSRGTKEETKGETGLVVL